MIAAVFPGQGSQRPGMGVELAQKSAVSRAVFDEVSQATGMDVLDLCANSDDDTLRQTQNAQIALYTAGLAAFAALRAALPELHFDAMAGHSVGEYTALAAAGVLTAGDGARLVQRRGDLMARAGQARPGTMAAVLGLPRTEVDALCAEASTDAVAVLANDNCPGQLVISGDVDAVHAASALATERGAKRVLPLNVSGAFHSPLMKESAHVMGEALKATTFRVVAGQPVVYANVTGDRVEGTSWAELLTLQLERSVEWTQTIVSMRRDGVKVFIECGSGEVLTGLLKRIDKEASGHKVVDMTTLNATVAALTEVNS